MNTNKTYTFFLLAVLAGLAFTVNAQETGASWENSYFPVKAEYVIGETIMIEFKCTIDPGYHIYSSLKTEKDGPLITEFVVEEMAGAELLGTFKERDGRIHTEFDSIFETEVHYYHDKVTFSQVFRITGKNVKIKGYISYGLCTDDGCVPGYNDINYTLRAKK